MANDGRDDGLGPSDTNQDTAGVLAVATEMEEVPLAGQAFADAPRTEEVPRSLIEENVHNGLTANPTTTDVGGAPSSPETGAADPGLPLEQRGRPHPDALAAWIPSS